MIKIVQWRDGQLHSGGEELYVGDDSTPTWIDLCGCDAATEQRWMERCGVHPLAMQDAQRDRHPPKLEQFEQQLFVLLRGIAARSEGVDYQPLQISYFIGSSTLLTIHRSHAMSIDNWHGSALLGSVLAEGPMALFLQLSKSLGQLYLDMLLEFEPQLSDAEDQLRTLRADDQLLGEMMAAKTRLRKLCRDHTYHHQVFSALRQLQSPQLPRHDHLAQDSYERFERVNSLSHLYYDLAGDLIDGHISLSSHRLNSTMRVLTVVTALFVPLSFLAGLYGMNFDHIPELHHPHGYFILLGAMATIATTLLALFRWKRWL
ncbi:metal transporter [Gammaproteobacteria bacterium LSUCC0057]|uniref:Metal transporter n=1 Tax=Gammaproteobacteria bacterium LSUCC0057 TaxID=2559237 RepID=A0A4Y8UG08_9GAMM|nr:metal transporter [Gammaproteobacteria bacterium LSUCC0057]